jgi:hypothetical protein
MSTASRTDRAEVTIDFHGMRVAVVTDHHRVAEAVASRFRPQLMPTSARPDHQPPAAQFEIVLGDVDPAAVASGRPVYESDLGDVRYDDTTERLTIRCEQVTVDADLRGGRVDIRYATGAPDELALAAHPLLTLPLLEILKRRGRYSLHAACVAGPNGGGVLLAGASGSGKSTTSVALAVAGYGFLADDMVFLEPRADRAPRVLAFPDELDLTDETVERFAALAHLRGRPTWGNRPKHQVRAEECLDVALTWSCDPHVVLFPRVTGAARTTIEPLSTADALFELAPNVLLTEPASSQEHLDAIGDLLRCTPTHQLLLGDDLDEVVHAVDALVRSEGAT